VVINPRSINALRNLTFTADYFDIQLQGAISRLSTTTILNKCYVQGISDFCQFITRRDQPSGAFSIGSVQQIFTTLVNSGGAFTRGLDFTLNYRQAVFGGTATFEGSWTHLLKNGVVPLQGDKYDNTMGEFGNPRDKAVLTLDWSSDTFGVTVTNQYIGKQMLDYENFQTTYVLADGSLPPKSLFTLGARVYTDVQVRFDVKKNWEFYLGAKNAFDVKMPPLYGSVGNFNPSTMFDPIGRRFYAGFRIKM